MADSTESHSEDFIHLFRQPNNWHDDNAEHTIHAAFRLISGEKQAGGSGCYGQLEDGSCLPELAKLIGRYRPVSLRILSKAKPSSKEIFKEATLSPEEVGTIITELRKRFPATTFIAG